jgi:hypothetical protein
MEPKGKNNNSKNLNFFKEGNYNLSEELPQSSARSGIRKYFCEKLWKRRKNAFLKSFLHAAYASVPSKKHCLRKVPVLPLVDVDSAIR